MAVRTTLTNRGMELLAQSSHATGQQYWIGYYSLAYVPSTWKSDGNSVDEPLISTNMDKLTENGDILYNIFQGDLCGTGYAGESDGSSGGDLFGLTLYEHNIQKNYRYVISEDGRNNLVSWENVTESSVKKLKGAVVYRGSIVDGDTNDKSYIPLPAPLYYIGPVTESDDYFNNDPSIYYPQYYSDQGLNLADSTTEEQVIRISTDVRGYNAMKTYASTPSTHSTNFLENTYVLNECGWYSADLTCKENSDVEFEEIFNQYCDEFWKLQTISNYNRYHAPINANGLTVDCDCACRNMAKVTKYFPISNYDVLTKTTSGTNEYATSIRLTIDVSIPSKKLTESETENYFDIDYVSTNRISGYNDQSGNDLFSSKNVSFKFNRIGIYAVPMTTTAYKVPYSTKCDETRLQFQVDTEAEPVLFAIIDWDNVQTLSDESDGSTEFSTQIELNLRSASDDSSIIRDCAIFYNLYEDDAITWYKNQLIANASICESVTNMGIELGYLKNNVIINSSPCCSQGSSDLNSEKNTNRNYLINLEDAIKVNEYGVKGRATSKEGAIISLPYDPTYDYSFIETTEYDGVICDSLVWLNKYYADNGISVQGTYGEYYDISTISIPTGWRIPTIQDVEKLKIYIKSKYSNADTIGYAYYIKSINNWNNNGQGNASVLSLQPNGAYGSISDGSHGAFDLHQAVYILLNDSTYTCVKLSSNNNDIVYSTESDITSIYSDIKYTVLLVRDSVVIDDFNTKYYVGYGSYVYGYNTSSAGIYTSVSGNNSHLSNTSMFSEIMSSLNTYLYGNSQYSLLLPSINVKANNISQSVCEGANSIYDTITRSLLLTASSSISNATDTIVLGGGVQCQNISSSVILSQVIGTTSTINSSIICAGGNTVSNLLVNSLILAGGNAINANSVFGNSSYGLLVVGGANTLNSLSTSLLLGGGITANGGTNNILLGGGYSYTDNLRYSIINVIGSTTEGDLIGSDCNHLFIMGSIDYTTNDYMVGSNVSYSMIYGSAIIDDNSKYIYTLGENLNVLANSSNIIICGTDSYIPENSKNMFVLGNFALTDFINNHTTSSEFDTIQDTIVSHYIQLGSADIAGYITLGNWEATVRPYIGRVLAVSNVANTNIAELTWMDLGSYISSNITLESNPKTVMVKQSHDGNPMSSFSVNMLDVNTEVNNIVLKSLVSEYQIASNYIHLSIGKYKIDCSVITEAGGGIYFYSHGTGINIYNMGNTINDNFIITKGTDSRISETIYANVTDNSSEVSFFAMGNTNSASNQVYSTSICIEKLSDTE